MACDTKPRPRQTLQERIAEVRKTIAAIDASVQSGRVKPKVGPQGAIAFEGLRDEDRAGITDACVYRLLMSTGSAMARMQLQRAEQLAGRSVSRQALAQGHHSHDGGKTWHGGH